MQKVYNKLVRDKIPSIIESEGKQATYKVLNAQEFKVCLRLKLTEEIHELLEAVDASNINSIMEEAADVMEVLDALLQAYNITLLAAALKQEDKREKKGGFKKKIFLLSVSDPNNNDT